MFHKRFNLFIGHFGSGKTEIALNVAFKLQKETSKTALVDLDIINPFFRSCDQKKALSEAGIRLIQPVYGGSNIDVPALPRDIMAIFASPSYHVVFDVGGDDLGAKAVSSLKYSIEKEAYALFFVVNTKRPNTATKEKIKSMLHAITVASRLQVTHLVNNTNLQYETTALDMLESQTQMEALSKETGIPLAFTCAISPLALELETMISSPILVINQYIAFPWKEGALSIIGKEVL